MGDLARVTKNVPARCNAWQPREIDVSASHHIKRTGFEAEHVQRCHVVRFVVAALNGPNEIDLLPAPMLDLGLGVANLIRQ